MRARLTILAVSRCQGLIPGSSSNSPTKLTITIIQSLNLTLYIISADALKKFIMRDELSDKIFNNFPGLFPLGSEVRHYGFECADGWYDIIYRLASDIERIIGEDKTLNSDEYTVFQVKEKFGTLCFYMSRYTEKMHERIGAAVEESGKTCETCGGEGKLLENDWVRTICDTCEAERRRRIEESMGRVRRDSGALETE